MREREEERNPDRSLTRNHSFACNVINAALWEISRLSQLRKTRERETRLNIVTKIREVIARLNILPCMRARCNARTRALSRRKATKERILCSRRGTEEGEARGWLSRAVNLARHVEITCHP